MIFIASLAFFFAFTAEASKISKNFSDLSQNFEGTITIEDFSDLSQNFEGTITIEDTIYYGGANYGKAKIEYDGATKRSKISDINLENSVGVNYRPAQINDFNEDVAYTLGDGDDTCKRDTDLLPWYSDLNKPSSAGPCSTSVDGSECSFEWKNGKYEYRLTMDTSTGLPIASEITTTQGQAFNLFQRNIRYRVDKTGSDRMLQIPSTCATIDN
ncbi:uncharacterized protein LOC141907319 [Tubulanus polymorphus]|uniref:uncharacterized protein LOC141907319 n=1 Tax=Tubulanus polymorphus TaxID=672921 RepID=UPI003DA2E366